MGLVGFSVNKPATVLVVVGRIVALSILPGVGRRIPVSDLAGALVSSAH